MKYLITILCILGFAPTMGAKPFQSKKGYLSHKLQVSTSYLHLSDPDWHDQWWRRNWIPQYQLGYDKYFLKVRYFTLGQYSLSNEGDLGRSHAPLVLNSDGSETIKLGSTIRYAYKTLDLIASTSILQKGMHDLQIGIGGSHRKGYESVILSVNQGTHWNEYDGELRQRNQWGAIAEMSYTMSFLNYLTASIDVGYRVYPESPGLLTIGIGFGALFQHSIAHHYTPKSIPRN